jgi:hypothetical protein
VPVGKKVSWYCVGSTVTQAKLAANRANAKLGGRPPGSMSPIKRDLSERCRVKDMRQLEILEDIAENSTNEGYRLTAIASTSPSNRGLRSRRRHSIFGDIAGRLV